MSAVIENNREDLSIDAERLVARTFMGRIEWEMIVVGIGQFLIGLVYGLWFFKECCLYGLVSF